MRLDLCLERLELGRGDRAGRAGELGELQLRRELLAELCEQVDVVLVERRPVGGVDDQRSDRAVRSPERHDRRRTERALGVAAGDPQGKRRDQRLLRRQGVEDRPDGLVAGPVVIGARPGEGEHAGGVGDGDRAEAELFEDLVGDRARGGLGETEPQLRQGRGEELERGRLSSEAADSGHALTVPSAGCTSPRPC